MSKVKSKNKVADNFEKFVKFVYKWRDKLGQQHFELNVHQKESPAERAGVYVSGVAMQANVHVSPSFLGEATDLQLERTAFHEVCEMMLHYVYVDMAAMYSHEYIQRRLHEIIRTLENTMFTGGVDV